MTINVANKVPFLGIMIAASSRAEAERLFAETALGQSVVAYSDKDKQLQFVTHAECSDILNPKSGQADLAEEKSLAEQLEFLSSAKDHAVHYTLCRDGCGAHLISESAEAMTHCISCGEQVQSLSEQEIEAALNEAHDDIDVSGVVAVAKSLPVALKRYVAIATGKQKGKFLQDKDGHVYQSNSTATHRFNTFTGNEDLSVVAAPAEHKALSSVGGNTQAWYYVCANTDECGSHVVSTSRDAVICPSCSSGLIENEDYTDNDELDVSVEDIDDNIDENGDFEETEDSESGKRCSASSDDEDCDDESEDDSDDSDEYDEESDDEEDSEESDSSAKLSNKKTAKSKKVMSKSSDDDEDCDDESEDDSEDEESEEEMSDEEDMDNEEGDDTDMTMNMSESTNIRVGAVSLAGSVEPKALHVCFATINSVPTWLAIANDYIVAKANPVTAAKHSDIFTNKVFGEAVLAAAKEHGVEQALSDMGFEQVSHDIQVDKLVQEQIEQQVSEQVAAVASDAQAKLDVIADRYKAALATAFSGINKGIFKGITNPMQSALSSALTVAGVRNADLLVGNAFESSSSQYIDAVMRKAQEIMEFTAQAQNEVAKMVSESNFQLQTDRKTIGDRLSSIATVIETDTKEPAVHESVSSTKKTDFSARADKALRFGRR